MKIDLAEFGKILSLGIAFCFGIPLASSIIFGDSNKITTLSPSIGVGLFLITILFMLLFHKAHNKGG